MAFERKWAAVPPTPLLSDGTKFGLVHIADTAGFYVKRVCYLVGSDLPPQRLQVKWVLSSTQMVVGPVDNKVGVNQGSDITAFNIASDSTIGASESDKNNIPEKDHYNAIYEPDPIVADRMILVDEYGDYYHEGNPLPIAFDGTVSVGDVNIQDKEGNSLNVNPDGSINVVITNDQNAPGLGLRYGETLSVPPAIETSVLSVVGEKRIQKIDVSGTNVATFTLKLDGEIIAKQRIWHGQFNASFQFENFTNGLKVQPGQTLTITARHDRPNPGDFNATAWFL